MTRLSSPLFILRSVAPYSLRAATIRQPRVVVRGGVREGMEVVQVAETKDARGEVEVVRNPFSFIYSFFTTTFLSSRFLPYRPWPPTTVYNFNFHLYDYRMVYRHLKNYRLLPTFQFPIHLITSTRTDIDSRRATVFCSPFLLTTIDRPTDSR